jgi:diguanylate cyclase (GGDEF)-like protein
MSSRQWLSGRQWRGAADLWKAARVLASPTKFRRIGIVPRLLASFVGVATLAIAANHLAGHSYVTRTTRVERPLTIVSQPAAAVPVLLEAPTAPSPPPKASEAYLAYSRALQRFSAAVSARAAGDDAAEDAGYRDAGERLEQAAARLAADVAKSDKKLAARAIDKTKETSESAAALLAEADQRHHLIAQYRQDLDGLSKSMKEALDGSFKIFGRFIAHEYLLQLDARLQGIRERLEDAIAKNATPAALSLLAASEHEYSATLEANRKSLARVEGQAWLDSTDRQFRALAAFRESLQRAQSSYSETLAKLTRDMADAAAIAAECAVTAPSITAGASLQLPAKQPVAAPALGVPATGVPGSGIPAAGTPGVAAFSRQPASVTTTTVRNDHARYTLVAEITIAVIISVFTISLLTVFSIVRPVRRLVDAAARLAAGDTGVTVARGGMKELDQLAGSFNQMAQHLDSAGEASRSYQARLEAEVAARTEQLRDLAERDSLTQLPNRWHGHELIEQKLEEARARGAYLGVYFLDLDNFKAINDSLGHAFGDQVLAAVAERLRTACASYGHAIRLGGDEFAIIHANAKGCEDIYEAAAQLVHAFHASLPLQQRELMVSVSCGVSVFPLHGETCADLLSCADAALYRAKSQGRNQVSVYTDDLLEAVSEKFSIEQRLRRAIERNEFELVFQPEVGVDSLRVELVEALLRWRQPDGRLAAPGEFLAVAEASGFIAALDNWVMSAAIEAAAAWYRGVWPEVRVAINVSSRQLLDLSFVDRLKELMALHRLPVRCLEIELTETVLQTGASTIRTLHALKAEGFSIGLDDFGTGYSSLTSLAQLPLSRVKLDRSLIANTDERGAAIALTIVSLCEHLHLQVTAEGIENAEQLEWLLGHDSVYLQGYFISRPLPFGDLEAALQTIPQQMALHVLTGARSRPRPESRSREVIPLLRSRSSRS